MYFTWFEIKTQCDRCSSPLMINALATRFLCGACQAEHSISHTEWRDLLGLLDGTLIACHGVRRKIHPVRALAVVALESAPGDPCCGQCGTPFPTQNLSEIAGRGGAPCGKCGNFVSVRDAPVEFQREVSPGATFLVGEDPAQLPARAEGTPIEPGPGGKPVVFTCPRCSGALEVDGKERTVACTYCSANVYLPDDLWHRLHPVTVVRRWYLQVDPALAKQRIDANVFGKWRFCLECGEALDAEGACARCALSSPKSWKYCLNCGAEHQTQGPCPKCSAPADRQEQDVPRAMQKELIAVMLSLVPPIGLGLGAYHLARGRRLLGWKCLGAGCVGVVAALAALATN
jgi:hypothetical protein